MTAENNVGYALLSLLQPPLEFFFQEQSYSSLHSGQSLALYHVRGRFGKSTHISMISNSVTHLRSYTNSAIADIAGNSAPISPVTPRDRRRRRDERRRLRIERRRLRIERRRLRIQRRYRRIESPPRDR